MFLLKAQIELFGLTAPIFSWVVSAALILDSVRIYTQHLRVSRNRQHILAIAEKRLVPLQDGASGPGRGLSCQAYTMMRGVFEDLPLLSTFWQGVASTVVVRADEKGEDRIWISEQLGIDAADLIDTQSYKTAPAVISGVGLLATFLAILVALLDVKLASHRVQGLDLLVQGLSGKFLSSVVAVACATILVYSEKGIYRPVKAGAASLEKALRNILPRLTPAQIMSDLHFGIESQSRLIGALSSDVTSSFKRGLDESLKPILEQIASTVGLVGAKIGKEDQTTVNDRLSRLFAEFGESLESTLHKMADRLDDSPAGATHREFGRISDSLSTTVTLLQGMNDQLTANQMAFNDLISLASSTTADEIASRQGQVEQLTGVVSSLMERLEEKTEESTGSMERALAAITFDMSNRVIDLSKQMAEVIEQSSERTTDRVRVVLDQAGSLSAQSAEQLSRLLDNHSAEMTRVEDLRTLLDSTIKGFAGSIGKYGEVTDGLRKVASQVNAGVASLAQVARSITESQNAAVQVSLSVSGQIESVRGFTRNQQEIWDRIQTSMTEYEKVFASVETHAGELLSQIARYLSGYSDTTQKHFTELTSAADNFIARATGRLSSSIDELGEQLDELQGALSDIGRVSRIAG